MKKLRFTTERPGTFVYDGERYGRWTISRRYSMQAHYWSVVSQRPGESKLVHERYGSPRWRSLLDVRAHVADKEGLTP